MSRLTHWNYKNTTLPLDSSKPYLKLGEIEDVEESIGIDLITLFKAVMDGFWYFNPFNQKEIIFAEPGNHPYNPRLIITKKEAFLLEGSGELTLKYTIKDYGITWSLDKKELENEIH